MKLFILFLLLLPTLLFSKGHATQYENPFSIVYGGVGTNIFGDYVSIASSVQCIEKDDHSCDHDYAGYLFDATTKYVNSVATSVIPLNSSTETLSLPSDVDGADILYAGLYWQGHLAGTDATHYANGIIGRDTVDFIDADNIFHALTADKLWYHDFWGDGTGDNGGYRSFYQGYKDVTSILKSSYKKGQTNRFTVGNVKSTIGSDNSQYFWTTDSEYNGIKMGFYGNWNLMIVYQHPNVAILSPIPKAKNITIFQGFDALIPLPTNTATRTKTIHLDLDGFLTSATTPINAKLFFYGSAGEKKLSYDSFKIQDKKTTNYVALSNTVNPVDDAFNGSVSTFGVDQNSSIKYYPGLDSDTFDISSAMDTKQSSTSLELSAKFIGNSGDQFFPGLIAFSTDIYEPIFCYDYAYQQQKTYFTEDNDGTQNPRLKGDVVVNEPVKLTIYIRNLVASDLAVKNMTVDIMDINTTQAPYIHESTQLSKTGQLYPTPLPDSSLSIGTNYIRNIPVGDMGANEYFYLYYDLNPEKTVLDMPINVSARYDLVVNSTTTIPYTLTVGSNLKMCSSTNFKYTPQKGLFNIVNNLYYTSPSTYYNNLPTAVTQRADNYTVLAYDANDTNLNTLQDRNVTVAVELIDAAAFHDTFASCKEPTSSISPRIWITFKNDKTTPFTAQEIINNFFTKNGSYSDVFAARKFYKTAKENAAFRISWTDDNNATQIETIDDGNGLYHLENFSSFATQSCVYPVTTDVSQGGTVVTKTYTQVAQACFNAGTSSASSMNSKELAACMECIYGQNLNFVCSRDNFSIRPEAFLIQLDDQNQTHPNFKRDITTLANSGSVGAVAPNNIDLAAAYNYKIEINATNHYTNEFSPGYTKTMNVTPANKAEYTWSPNPPISSGICNDENNKSITMRFVDGAVDRNTSVNQVGQYKLSVNDTTWTTVDSNPYFMTHHDNDPYFLSSSYPDCTQNSSIVTVVGTGTLNGCNISSQHTTSAIIFNGSGTSNSIQHVQYNDYNVTFHPYTFVINNTLKIGPSDILPPATLPFVYMANIGADENMSVHLHTTIAAYGAHSTKSLTNFVAGCYEKPLNISIDKSPTKDTNLSYVYRFHDFNATTGGSILTAYDVNASIAAGNINDDAKLTTLAGTFQRDLNGTINTQTNLNFKRAKNMAVNPEEITFVNYKVATTETVNADLIINRPPSGTTSLNNQKIIYYYGRTNVPRKTIVCRTSPCLTHYDPNSANNPDHTRIYVYDEIYCYKTKDGNTCDKNLLPAGTTNSSDLRWWINLNQDQNVTAKTDGEIGSVKEIASTEVAEINQSMIYKYQYETVLKYSGSLFPYTANMENNASDWLLYDELDANTSTNKFRVDFINASDWNGVHETNTTTFTNGAVKTNRRLMW